MNAPIEDIKTKLRYHGLKATHQRMAVLSVLSECNNHPSAEMIMQTLIDQGIHMSFATVYNVLETLLETGIIQKISDVNEVMRFDYNTDFHVHVFNEKTGEIKDYFDEDFCSNLQNYIKQNFNAKGEIAKINLSVMMKG